MKLIKQKYLVYFILIVKKGVKILCYM